jgi:hypothetical protein
MRGHGRGTHPSAALRIAINAIETWAQRIPYHEVPPLPQLEVLKICIANEIVRELTRAGGPTTKELLKDRNFKPSAAIPDATDLLSRWLLDDAKEESIKWLRGQLEASSSES